MCSPLPAADRIDRYTRALVAYMRSNYPMRFYQGEKWWALHASAAVLRMADIADSALSHLPERRDLDAASVVRDLYELGVTLAWVLIDPIPRKELWEGEALRQQLKLHNDLLTFGETLLTPAEVQYAQVATGLPALADRALECDSHWSSRISGFHAPGHLLSFRGLYNAVYRLGSQSAHASIASLLPYVSEQAKRFVVAAPPAPSMTLPYALISPLLAMPLVVLANDVTWIDPERVQELNDLACTSGPLGPDEGT